MTWHQHLHLGNSAFARGLAEEAEYQYKTAIQKVRDLSIIDPEVTEAMRNLARIVLSAGRPQEALSLVAEALEIDQSYWFGPSTQVCEDLLLFGDAAALAGRAEDAMQAYQRAIGLHEQLFGAEHDQTMKALSRLMLLQLESFPAQVDPIAARVLQYYRQTCPPGTLCKALGLDFRLKQLTESDRAGDSDRFFKTATAVLRKHLGDHNREIAYFQKTYADVLARANKQLSAWRLNSTAERQKRRDDLPARADDLMLRGLYEEAEQVLRMHLSFMQIQYGPAHAQTIEVRKKYATILKKLGSRDNANRGSLRERVLEVVTRMALTGSPWQTACSEAMQIHRIGESEVQARVDHWRSASSDESTHNAETVSQPIVMAGKPTGRSTAAAFSEHPRQVPDTLSSCSIALSSTVWPAPQDYNEAVQNPNLVFFDPELKSALVEVNDMGLPVMVSGSFASVYRFYCGSAEKAVRFFLSPIRDREYRYQQLSDYICSDDLIYTVNFEYQTHGVRFGANDVPLLKMEWVQGEPLHLFIEKQLLQEGALEHLQKIFRRMSAALHSAGVAHGDLQHGNILVRNDELVLVDYDGMYVPALAGHTSPELGHPNYQHPRRNESHFGPYLDNFSIWVIDFSLFALAIDPTLWFTLGGGDECLLFRRNDFVAPRKSKSLATLLNHPSADIRQGTRFLLGLVNEQLESIPFLGEDGSAIPNCS